MEFLVFLYDLRQFISVIYGFPDLVDYHLFLRICFKENLTSDNFHETGLEVILRIRMISKIKNDYWTYGIIFYTTKHLNYDLSAVNLLL